MQPTDDILQRIDKLFRLGEHPTSNPGEAANALGLAQAMLLKHNLTRESIRTVDAPTTEGVGKVEIHNDTGHDWKVRLASVIAKANLCTVVNDSNTKTTHLFGARTNVLAVVKMFDWITRELEFQAMRDWKEYKADSGTEASRTWKGAFFDGAIVAVRDRLQPPVDTFAQGEGRSLVLANDARVKAARDKVFPSLGRSRHTVRRDSDGYGAGKRAGAGVRFGAQGSLTGGARSLSAGR